MYFNVYRSKEGLNQMLSTKIYLDNAATTKISDSVFEAMIPWLKEGYGNASSIYTLGRQSAIALSNARAQCAEALGCEPREIFFTGGGSESDNWAIKTTAHMMAKKGKKHLITSVFEHHAVLHCMESLEKEGFEVTYLPVYENGIVKADKKFSFTSFSPYLFLTLLFVYYLVVFLVMYILHHQTSLIILVHLQLMPLI